MTEQEEDIRKLLNNILEQNAILAEQNKTLAAKFEQVEQKVDGKTNIGDVTMAEAPTRAADELMYLDTPLSKIPKTVKERVRAMNEAGDYAGFRSELHGMLMHYPEGLLVWNGADNKDQSLDRMVVRGLLSIIHEKDMRDALAVMNQTKELTVQSIIKELDGRHEFQSESKLKHHLSDVLQAERPTEKTAHSFLQWWDKNTSVAFKPAGWTTELWEEMRLHLLKNHLDLALPTTTRHFAKHNTMSEYVAEARTYLVEDQVYHPKTTRVAYSTQMSGRREWWTPCPDCQNKHAFDFLCEKRNENNLKERTAVHQALHRLQQKQNKSSSCKTALATQKHTNGSQDSAISTPVESTLFVIDSAASHNMTNDRYTIASESPADGEVMVANGKKVKVDSVGTQYVAVKNADGDNTHIVIPEVYYVPELSTNLLSVRSLVQAGYMVLFSETGVVLIDKSWNMFLLGISHEDGLWYTQNPPSIAGVAMLSTKGPTSTDMSVEVDHEDEDEVEIDHTDFFVEHLHSALGHPNHDVIRTQLKLGLFEGRGIKHGVREAHDCVICATTKSTRQPFRSAIEYPRATYKLEITHSDVFGPFLVKQPDGKVVKHYVLTMIDDYSRYATIYIMKDRSSATVAKCFEEYRSINERAFAVSRFKMRGIVTDGGTEYLGALEQWRKQLGIEQYTTPTDTPPQNGTAERYNKRMKDIGRPILKQSGLPGSMWSHVLKYATACYNATYSKALGDVPYIRWHGSKPNINLYQPFGCRAYVHSTTASKLGPTSMEGVFIGVSEGTRKSYFVWCGPGKIVHSHDVTFSPKKFGIPDIYKDTFEFFDPWPEMQILDMTSETADPIFDEFEFNPSGSDNLMFVSTPTAPAAPTTIIHQYDSEPAPTVIQQSRVIVQDNPIEVTRNVVVPTETVQYVTTNKVAINESPDEYTVTRAAINEEIVAQDVAKAAITENVTHAEVDRAALTENVVEHQVTRAAVTEDIAPHTVTRTAVNETLDIADVNRTATNEHLQVTDVLRTATNDNLQIADINRVAINEHVQGLDLQTALPIPQINLNVHNNPALMNSVEVRDSVEVQQKLLEGRPALPPPSAQAAIEGPSTQTAEPVEETVDPNADRALPSNVPEGQKLLMPPEENATGLEGEVKQAIKRRRKNDEEQAQLAVARQSGESSRSGRKKIPTEKILQAAGKAAIMMQKPEIDGLMTALIATIDIRPDPEEDPGDKKPIQFTKEPESGKVLPPRSYKEEQAHVDKCMWELARGREYESLLFNDTWELVDRTPDMHVIPFMWLYNYKEGAIDGMKVRGVAGGNYQIPGVEYMESFAPVCLKESFRLMLSEALREDKLVHQMDVKTAFLNGELNETIYMQQPPGTVETGNEAKVCKLKKSLYGLVQAPLCWNKKFHEQMTSMGFTRTTSDYATYTKEMDQERITVCLYVDDLTISSKNIEDIKWVKKQLSDAFEMKDLGEVKTFLGVEITREGKRATLSQSKLIKELLWKTGMNECQATKAPCNEKWNKMSDPESPLLDDEQATKYRSVVGSIGYLEQWTRPDLSVAYHILSKKCHAPTKEDSERLKRVLRYLVGTKDHCLEFNASNTDSFIGYVDADFANDATDSKSISGYIFFVNGCPISWKTKKQSIVALSTGEAEYYALHLAVRTGVWIQNQLYETTGEWKTFKIMEDNSACMELAKKGAVNMRNRHFALKYHFSRDYLEKGYFEMEWVSTDEQAADGMTKPLGYTKFSDSRERLCVIDPNLKNSSGSVERSELGPKPGSEATHINK